MWQLALTIIAAVSLSACSGHHENYVADSDTAAKIAEAVLAKIYGAEVLQQRPLTARLEGEYWILDGSPPGGAGNYKGGRAHIEISQYDGAIRNVTHGK